MNQSLMSIASTYEEPEQVVELYRSDERLLEGLRASVLEEQVMEWIADHATVSEEALPFSDAMQSSRAG